ncbi:MAG TPA: hypothetical protein VNB22_10455 [Pyrinomonadaceae bacterium]|jgi:hypothetical protein|nr:hypothetical protein [Pyrinomonadaceae bacterium]
MKSTIKLVLVVCLFSSVAFADGEMGNGTKSCPTGSTCLTTTQPTEKEITPTESTDSVLDFVREYLDSMLKYFEN